MTDRKPVNQVRVCIDANDVTRVANFWAALLDYEIREIEGSDESGGWLHLDTTSTTLPWLTIQPVPEVKGVKNRVHLDIFVTDPDPWIERCIDLGGALLWRSEEPDDWFQVIADPEGNELCICRSAAPRS
jgi:predicted enzyme related to lactoylglutathione lyase